MTILTARQLAEKILASPEAEQELPVVIDLQDGRTLEIHDEDFGTGAAYISGIMSKVFLIG